MKFFIKNMKTTRSSRIKAANLTLPLDLVQNLV